MSQASEKEQDLEFRVFIRKLLRSKGITHEDLARKLGTPESLVERRAKQINFFLNDPEGGQPRAGLAKAIERALEIKLPAEDYGWDPQQP